VLGFKLDAVFFVFALVRNHADHSHVDNSLLRLLLSGSTNCVWINFYLPNIVSASRELNLVLTNAPFGFEWTKGKLDPAKVILAEQVRLLAISDILLGKLHQSILSQFTDPENQLFECFLVWLGHDAAFQSGTVDGISIDF